MGSLRATRPSPIGGERRAGARRTTASVAATEAPKPAKAAKPAATKAATASKPTPKKAAKPATTKETAKPQAGKPTPGKATVKPTKRVAPKPAATRVPPREPDGRPSGPPRGSEIVTTAVQAAGELAQIGATVGGQLLKRAARRIPRP
jgi:hypothetical protein